MHFIVIERHRSAYRRPLRFAQGTLLEVGPRYESEPGMRDWYLCSCTGQEPGWVPEQLIERLDFNQGRALDHYCAHELDVDPGQLVQQLHLLNGWLWCRRHGDGELGWLPAGKLQQLNMNVSEPAAGWTGTKGVYPSSDLLFFYKPESVTVSVKNGK